MRLALCRTLFLWLLLLLLDGNACAQLPILAKVLTRQEYTIEQISLGQGLSQGMIFSMLQDTLGYIWAGTKEGLNRYDGTRIKVFRHHADDPLSISGNVVTAIALDNKQRLWAATSGNGINLFDPGTESFIHFTHEQNQAQSIPADNISRICKDGSGNLIFEVAETGYVVMIEKPGKHQQLKDAFEFKPIKEVYPQLTNLLNDRLMLARLQFSQGGDLWYYVNDTIYGYTAAMLRNGSAALKFYYPGAENVFEDARPPFIFDAKQNRTFITSYGHVLKQFNPTTKIFEPVLQLPSGYSFIYSVFIDGENNVWSWQDGNHVFKVNLADGHMELIQMLWQNGDRGAKPTCSFSFEGTQGNLWLQSTGYGIFKISSRNKLFKQRIGTSPWCMRIERVGEKAAYHPQDLEKLNRCFNTMKSKSNKMPQPRHYTNFALDNQGLFWTASYNRKTDENSIACIDPVTCTYHPFRDSAETGTGFYATPVFLDNRGEVWFGEQRSKKEIHLYHLNQNTKKVESFPFPVQSNHDPDIFIADYYPDADGLLWLATRQGLFSFRPATKQWQHYTNQLGDVTSLSGNLLLSLCPDPTEPNRYLWVGTEGAGLNKFDKHTHTFSRFDVTNGLPNNVVYGIQSDAHNNLWLSTNHGICQFNPKTFTTRNFTEADGLVSNEFNRYEFSKTPDGTLYFGSPSGICYFNPEDFYKETKPSAAVINKLELLNKEVIYQHQNSDEQKTGFYLPAPIEQCKELVFNYNHRMITLGFSLLDLTVPAQNKFKYMLEGFDKTWIDAGTKNEATYTNLSPGSYVFKVLGCNSGNIWCKNPSTLKICVLSPWWGTWWFRTFVTVLFVALLYALYRYRLFKVLELERVRNRIAQDLHDEIGSTLSSISLYGAAIQKNPNGLSKQNSHILSKITQSTTHMMESMNDMVWTIKADNDHFEHVINRMRAFAVNMTEAKGIELHFTTDAQIQTMTLNMEQRKNIYLIFKEAVNNALKYSGCRSLSVAISSTKGKLEMSIKDDGRGFELETVNQNNTQLGGNGLRGMKLRAKNMMGDLQIVTGKGEGTEVIFSMSVS